MSSTPIPPTKRSKRWLLIPWVIVALIGFAFLQNYSNTAGKTETKGDQWPVGTSLIRAKERPTLVMFLHPKCPCSQASLEEISRVLATHPDAYTLNFVFFKPSNEDDNWAETSLWKTVSKLPHAQAIIDQDAHEAKLFGALTSGDTFVYSPTGKLEFRGGVTPARGSIGDNAGIETLTLLAQGRTAVSKNSPVFGCPIVKETP